MLDKTMLLTISILSWEFLYILCSPLFKDYIHLEKLSTLYLPYQYINSTPLYHYREQAVEQSTYDPENKILYVVGGSIIHAIDIQDATNPTIVYYREVDHVDITDVEFCGGYLFVSMHNVRLPEQGRVVVFHSLSSSQPMTIKYNITAGPGPDMLAITKDCKTVLVALEGEVYMDNGTVIDPEGGVGLIRIENNMTYKILNFRYFNTRWSELESKGLHFVYRRDGNAFSNDVEPEYIAFNKKETKAYISLQENNAIAVLDLASERIEDIFPLGYKSWENSRLDASNKDNGINIKPWPVLGMYQPDAIQTMEWAGTSYLVTANEGDAKDFPDFNGFSETVRIKDIVLSENSSVLTWAKEYNKSSIQEKDMLGRLEVSSLLGMNTDGSYDTLYSFGGRSFSIWNLDTMDLVYDSGSQIEDLHQQYFANLFNANGGKSEKTVDKTFDSRSDDKGPECESVHVAYIGNKVVIFVGSERPGSIAIFAIDNEVTEPKFQSLWIGIEETDGTWEELYNRRKISEIDPEDIKYIPPVHSPTGDHMLIVAGTVSGTVSLFKINGLSNSPTNKEASINSGSHLLWMIMVVLCVFVRHWSPFC